MVVLKGTHDMFFVSEKYGKLSLNEPAHEIMVEPEPSLFSLME